MYLTWWETSKNETSERVFRGSNDNGATFVPILKLAANQLMEPLVAVVVEEEDRTSYHLPIDHRHMLVYKRGSPVG